MNIEEVILLGKTLKEKNVTLKFAEEAYGFCLQIDNNEAKKC